MQDEEFTELEIIYSNHIITSDDLEKSRTQVEKGQAMSVDTLLSFEKRITELENQKEQLQNELSWIDEHLTAIRVGIRLGQLGLTVTSFEILSELIDAIHNRKGFTQKTTEVEGGDRG